MRQKFRRFVNVVYKRVTGKVTGGERRRQSALRETERGGISGRRVRETERGGISGRRGRGGGGTVMGGGEVKNQSVKML